MSTTQTTTKSSSKAVPLGDVALGSMPAVAEEAATKVPTSRLVTMQMDRFFGLLVHPQQRDTDKHALRAAKDHLKESHPVHAHVTVAEFEGRYYVVDGHTRRKLWQDGSLPRPPVLYATLWTCHSYDQLIDLYKTFDYKGATETASDKLSGYLREQDIMPSSQMMRRYMFSSALRLAYDNLFSTRDYETQKAVEVFKNEIAMIDEIDPDARHFKIGIMAATLLILKKHGRKDLPFFEAYNQNRGVKTEEFCDGVQALRDVSSTKASTGRKDSKDIAERTISCFESWLAKRNYTLTKMGAAGVKRTDIGSYCRSKGLRQTQTPA